MCSGTYTVKTATSFGQSFEEHLNEAQSCFEVFIKSRLMVPKIFDHFRQKIGKIDKFALNFRFESRDKSCWPSCYDFFENGVAYIIKKYV